MQYSSLCIDNYTVVIRVCKFLLMGYILIKYNWNVFLFYKQYLGEWILYGGW